LAGEKTDQPRQKSCPLTQREQPAAFGQRTKPPKSSRIFSIISIGQPGGDVTISGKKSQVRMALRLLTSLRARGKQLPARSRDIQRAAVISKTSGHEPVHDSRSVVISTSREDDRAGKARPETVHRDIRNNDLCSRSVRPEPERRIWPWHGRPAVLRKQFRRIIFTRPAVEAGEKLGFLPGDIPRSQSVPAAPVRPPCTHDRDRKSADVDAQRRRGGRSARLHREDT